eukprot:TCONS_00013278-protein
MSTENLILIIVLGGVFLIVVAWAIFFWYRYTKFHSDLNNDVECSGSQPQSRIPILQRLARSMSGGGQHSTNQNNQENSPLNQSSHDEVNTVLPENTTVSRLSHGPPSYNELRGSFTHLENNGESNSSPPSYHELRDVSSPVVEGADGENS